MLVLNDDIEWYKYVIWSTVLVYFLEDREFCTFFFFKLLHNAKATSQDGKKFKTTCTLLIQIWPPITFQNISTHKPSLVFLIFVYKTKVKLLYFASKAWPWEDSTICTTKNTWTHDVGNDTYNDGVKELIEGAIILKLFPYIKIW